MFFSGSLQEGIVSALQNSKAVVCFVHDGSETSILWERVYFQERSIARALEANAVVLKLDSDSQEVGFLQAYSPIEEPPVVIVIRSGQLKDSLDHTLSQDVFTRRLFEALGLSTAEAQAEAILGSSISDFRRSPNAAVNTAMPSGTSGSQRTSHSEDAQAMLAERKARLEAHQKVEEAREKAERAAIAKARREEAEASAPDGFKRANELEYAQKQRQRQKDARLERERILRLVEHDKAERREREQRRRAQTIAAQEPDSPETRHVQRLTPTFRPTRQCAIQVRLLDGTSMRKIFEHSATLGDDVRPWIDAERTEGDAPYTFRQIRTPLPNYSVDVSEEGQTLQNVGLTPSATLVLVPVKGFSDAYSDENAGLLSRGLSSGYGLVSSGVGLVGSAVGRFFGSTAEQAAPTADTSPEAPNPPNIINTLRDHRPDEDQQFYNGNQLNFEPRKDESSSKND